MKSEERYTELGLKILKIGEALIMEGNEKEDYNIVSVGNIMLFLSSIIYDENDIKLLSELCSMIAAKNMMENDEIIDILHGLSIDELQQLIKLIKGK
jgi:hypothetical protein